MRKHNLAIWFVVTYLFGAICTGCGNSLEDSARPAAVSPPGNTKSKLLLADAQRAFQQGSFRTALALMDSAKQYTPGFADIHYLRGHVLLRLGQFDEARNAFETVLSLNPEFKGAFYNLANIAFQNGDFPEALGLYRKEQEIAAASAVWVQMGRTYAVTGKADSARWAYEQALQIDSLYAPALGLLSQLYENGGRYEKALEYAQRALGAAPNNVSYHYATGLLLLRAGRAEEAADELRAVLAQRPWHDGAHYNLGQALLRLGRAKEAEEHLAAADSARAQQAEIEQLRASARDNPGVPLIWISLGDILLRTGQYDEAVEAFNVAIYLDPGNLLLQNNVAGLSLMLGHANEAIRRYQAILQHDSTFTDVWFNLGLAHARAGNTNEARAAWRNTLKYEPNHPAALRYLAEFDHLP